MGTGMSIPCGQRERSKIASEARLKLRRAGSKSLSLQLRILWWRVGLQGLEKPCPYGFAGAECSMTGAVVGWCWFSHFMVLRMTLSGTLCRSFHPMVSFHMPKPHFLLKLKSKLAYFHDSCLFNLKKSALSGHHHGLSLNQCLILLELWVCGIICWKPVRCILRKL